MFSYKLTKIAIFFIYWLGFVPWSVLILHKQNILRAVSLQDIFLQYTTLLFVLIVIYVIIHQIFDYLYMRRKIKRVVRRLTIRHQLKRLEKGEIDLVSAQRLSTFTTLKEPSKTESMKRKGQSIKKGKEQEQDKKEKDKPEKEDIKKQPAPTVTKDLIKEKPAKEDDKKLTKAPKPPVAKELRKEPEKIETKATKLQEINKKMDILESSACKDVVIEINQ